MPRALKFPRNDVRQYDDLVDAWWDERGVFAMLHWIAKARASLVPDARREGAVLLDVACGGGLLAPRISTKGYRHVGIDLNALAVDEASRHGVDVVEGNVYSLPIATGSVDVVCAGEIFEHVDDVPLLVAECARVLRTDGLVVIDTIANTRLARVLAVSIAERVPGGAPRGIHDPALFVDRTVLANEFARHGIALTLRGLRPPLHQVASWKLGRRDSIELQSSRFTSVLFQAWGSKAAA